MCLHNGTPRPFRTLNLRSALKLDPRSILNLGFASCIQHGIQRRPPQRVPFCTLDLESACRMRHNILCEPCICSLPPRWDTRSVVELQLCNLHLKWEPRSVVDLGFAFCVCKVESKVRFATWIRVCLQNGIQGPCWTFHLQSALKFDPMCILYLAFASSLQNGIQRLPPKWDARSVLQLRFTVRMRNGMQHPLRPMHL